MKRKPRKTSDKLLNKKTFIKSIIQGLVIFAFSFGTYYYNLINTGDAMLARTSGLSIIIMANLFLVIVNSSSRDFAFQTIKKLIKNKVMIGIIVLTFLLLLAIIYSPINQFLKLTALTVNEFMLYIFLAFISVSWYEIIKLGLKLRWWSSGISN